MALFRSNADFENRSATGNCAWLVTGAGGDVMGGPVLSVLVPQEACRSAAVVTHGQRTGIATSRHSATFWDTLVAAPWDQIAESA